MTSFSSDVKYAGCRLLLYGEDLDPREIDKVSLVGAHESYKKGDAVSQGHTVRKRGMWSMRHVSEEQSMSDDLSYFLSAFRNAPMPLTKILGVDSVRLSLWIYDLSKEDTSELLIGIDEIEKLHRLGAQLYITSFKDGAPG